MNYTKLSKTTGYALRHAPWEYELEMDETGRVPVEQLLHALREEAEWKDLTENDLAAMIEQSDKKRYELKDGMIRAYYGHSIPMKIIKEEKMPPETLYHGTARRFLKSIMEKGLLPSGRQYVHLSLDTEMAQTVGRRRDGKPCILRIDAGRAWRDGLKFYYGNESVWLADTVPVKYITVE